MHFNRVILNQDKLLNEGYLFDIISENTSLFTVSKIIANYQDVIICFSKWDDNKNDFVLGEKLINFQKCIEFNFENMCFENLEEFELFQNHSVYQVEFLDLQCTKEAGLFKYILATSGGELSFKTSHTPTVLETTFENSIHKNQYLLLKLDLSEFP